MSVVRRTSVLEALLVVALVLTTVGAVLLPLAGPGGLGLDVGGSLSVEAELRDPALPPEVPGAPLRLTEPVTATAVLQEPTAPQRLGLVGGSVAKGATALAVLVLLLQIARTLRNGDVFVPVNARRLQVIAGVIAVGGLGSQLLEQVGRAAALFDPSIEDRVVGTFGLSLLPLAVAFGVGVAAEVFRQGAALRADVEGLV